MRVINELDDGRFSLLKFYERRARRILPALFFIVLFCIPFSWFLLKPRDMMDFAQSLVAVSTFSSNILFWIESGYFDTAAELKPLLHTWSLAVEEQFYILFPIFLITAWGFGKRLIVWMLIAAFFISLATAHWGAYYKPVATFFWFPTRAWELLIGSLAAFYLQRGEVIVPLWLNNLLSAAGLVAILYSVFAFDKSTPFPSLYALVPTLGTVFIILFARKNTWVHTLLSLQGIVGVGLISYSLYLWHQPVFAFWRHYVVEPTHTQMIFLSLLCAPLAYITYRFVEAPFRGREAWFNRRQVFTVSSVVLTSLIAVGLAGHILDGFRYNSNTAQEIPISEEIESDIFLIGDSHAAHLIKGLQETTSGEVFSRTSGGCVPFRNVDRYDSRVVPGACSIHTNSALDEIVRDEFSGLVILSSMGPVYLTDEAFKGQGLARVNGQNLVLMDMPWVTNRFDIFEVGLRRTLSELSENERVSVIVAIDIPELGIPGGCVPGIKRIQIFSISITQDYLYPKEDCKVRRADYELRASSYRSLLIGVVKDFPRVQLFDPVEHFCDEDYCIGYDEDFGYLYRDADHLSLNGSRYFAARIAPLLMRIEVGISE